MYKISEFSKITHLTVKALRYYDEEEILKPSYRAENGYRYYDDHDFSKARLIVLLRDLSFSIAEIKDILVNYESQDDLSYFLTEKQQLIAAQIKKEKELIKKINLYLQPKEMEAGNMNYHIEQKEFEDVMVATIRYKGRYSDVGKYIGTIYKEAKGKTAGVPFCCYYDADYQEEADIELCVPVKGMVNGPNIVCKKLPRIRAISTTHVGSYETISLAYKALLDYATEHQLECKIPSREIYHKGPGMIFKGNPQKYVTEIVIPI
ncbi:MerR family transcriptional regulator [Dehalobacter sp. DCM]|uniref:MerR family transcriptional regulator n=1 Tax=Dehalobacter sp. DCM TaxID=2907827 RepID=UPI0030812BCB|nr:MerR family transcriptional regulator [Dehalobacter sp. DCM]